MVTDSRLDLRCSGIMRGPAAFIYEPWGECGVLSNFAVTPFYLEGERWETVEHYYQAAKFQELNHQALIRQARTARAAKKLAWKELESHVRPNWDDIRVEVMAKAVEAKFSQDSASRQMLLKSWPMPIREDSPTDDFWGVGSNGRGRNVLGTLLEETRLRLSGRLSPWVLSNDEATLARGGASRIEWVPLKEHVARFNANQSISGRLAFRGFEKLGIGELTLKRVEEAGLKHYLSTEQMMLGGPLSDLFKNNIVHTHVLRAIELAHSTVADEKYAGYTWYQDARSRFDNWISSFFGIIGSASRLGLWQSDILVVGAGSGNEAGQIWLNFGSRVTLMDIGARLVENCMLEAPSANVLQGRAEDLSNLKNDSFDIYVALRTFESFFFDPVAALREGRRVLRRNGLLVISISNGYLTEQGEIISGHIVNGDRLDSFSPWKRLTEVGSVAHELGFTDFRFFDLGSEVGIIASWKE